MSNNVYQGDTLSSPEEPNVHNHPDLWKQVMDSIGTLFEALYEDGYMRNESALHIQDALNRYFWEH